MATYSFVDNVMSITGPGGSFTIGGQGAGNTKEGFEIEQVGEQNVQTPGADGQVMNSLIAATQSKLRVRLLKTSPVNSQLSSLYATQKLSSAAWGQNVISVQNTVLGDGWTLSNVAFSKRPKVVYSAEGGMNEWEFDVGNTAMALGGGGTVASAAALVQASV